MTTDNSTTGDSEERRIALKLLSAGVASPSEVAEALGVSPQAVNYWISVAKVNWRKARKARIASELRKISK